MFLNREGYLPLFTNTWSSFANFEVQSMLAGAFLSKYIGLNMALYFWVEIFFILIINISVYFLVKTLTDKSLTAFIAAFLFTVYFFGIGFFLPNWYATFVQRVIFNLPLLLLSFLFLHRFLAENKVNYYIISISLFFLSIFLAQFGILFSYSIILYSIYWEVLRSFRIRSLLRGLLISFPYVVIVIFFLLIQQKFGENVGSKYNLFYFLFHPGTYHYVEGVARQLVYMSQYPSVVQAMKSGRHPLAFTDPVSTYKFVFPILLTYGMGSILIWVRGKEYRPLLLTIVSGIVISLFINILLDRFDFRSAAGVNRYYYYPSILLSMYWALLLTTIVKRGKFIIIGGALLGFFLVNAALFRQFFGDLHQYSVPTAQLYQYIVRNFDQLPPHSYVIVGPTADFGPYETTFITEQLGEKRGITFSTENASYPKGKPPPTAIDVLKLTYDKQCSCVQKEILKRNCNNNECTWSSKNNLD